MKPLLVSFLFVASLTMGCVSLLPGGDAPPLSLYTIIPDPPLDSIMPPPRPTRLKLALLEVDSMMQRTEILVRSEENPSDVRYLSHHRWAEFPAIQATECLREHWQTSGAIGVVLSHNSRAAYDAILRGRILRFEGIESQDGSWKAHFVLELWLQGESRIPVPLERLDVTEVCETNDAQGLAKALSLAVRQAAADSLPIIRISLLDSDPEPRIPFQ